MSGLFSGAFELKEILAKADPTSEDIERVTKECLNNFCQAFLQTRLIRTPKVVPSIVRACQAFCGMPEGNWNHSTIVYNATIKNLGNVINTWVNTWKHLDKNEVIEATKRGIQSWVEEVIKENEV